MWSFKPIPINSGLSENILKSLGHLLQDSPSWTCWTHLPASSGLTSPGPIVPTEMNLPAFIHIPPAMCFPKVFAEKVQTLLGIGSWITAEPSSAGEGYGCECQAGDFLPMLENLWLAQELHK